MTRAEAPYTDVSSLLAQHSRQFPSRVFIESIHQGTRITFAEADRACNRLAHVFAARGLRANDRVAILSENSLEAILIFYGVLRFGAAVNPINVEESSYNIRQILEDVRPKLVLVHGGFAAERPDVVRDAPGECIPFGDWGAADPAGSELFGMVRAVPDVSFGPPVGGADDMGVVVFTSGTTERPKGVLISHAGYSAMVQEVAERFEIGPDDRVLEYRAYSWESPQLLAIGPALQKGCTLVLARKFSQSHFFDWLRDYRVTVAAGVPTVLQMLLARPLPVHKRDLPALRFMTSSSAPLAPETHEAFEAQYGIPIVQGCGMSEAGFMAGNAPSSRKMGSIGRPMRFTTLAFVDGTGRPCPPGEEGEMVVSGWKLAAGYVAPHGGMAPIPHDAFPTGDMGYRDAEGFIFLTGRKKDLIIRGGVNISPMEITNTLLEHPDVHDAATAGVPDPIYGEEVASFVVRRPGSTVDAEALGEHCRKRLPDFKVPKVVLFVDAIPKTDRGKVAKGELLKVWERAQPSPRGAGALRAEIRGPRTERPNPPGRAPGRYSVLVPQSSVLRCERSRAMGHQDLRDWIEQVDAIGELRRITGARWEDEIGPITELAQHREDGPCVLFDEVPGFPKGYRVAVNSLGSLRRAALTLHMEPRPTAMELVRAWRERSRTLQPIRPKVVTQGPVLENVFTGDRVNMLKFPTPKWHEHDGGRYIGTGSVDITRDPEGGWINLGTYRVMVHDERTLGFYISPGKHGRIHREQTFKAGKTMKVAVSFGQDPLLFLAGSIEVPFGQSEYDWAGAVRGAPVEVIMGEETGLPLPAHAEIVIEGEALPDERRPEGPFGEWTGYYASDVRPEPVMRVKRLMHRNDPILLGSPPGKPPSELTAYRSVMRSALIWDQMEAAGVPGVQGVWCHPAGGTRLLVVVSIRQMFPGHAKQAGAMATQCRAGAYLGRYTVVVDEDVDPTDLYDVVWAVCTRSDPERSIDILRRCWSGPLDPIIPLEEKGFNSRAIIDATRPYEWRDKFPAVAQASPGLRRRTLEKWGAHLFGNGGK